MVPIILKEETGSTNDDIWEIFRGGRDEPIAVLAARQKKGRGRRGSRWYSDVAGNLYLSVLFFIDSKHHGWLPFVPLMTATRVLSVLRGYTDRSIGIKWPNDILVGDKKIGGILVESRSGKDYPRFPVVIGIGLNLNSDPCDYPEELRKKTAVLRDLTGRDLPLMDIADEIIYNLEGWFMSDHCEGSFPRMVNF